MWRLCASLRLPNRLCSPCVRPSACFHPTIHSPPLHPSTLASPQVYRVRGSEEEGGVLNVSAACNTLNLVLRDEGLMKFVKVGGLTLAARASGCCKRCLGLTCVFVCGGTRCTMGNGLGWGSVWCGARVGGGFRQRVMSFRRGTGRGAVGAHPCPMHHTALHYAVDVVCPLPTFQQLCALEHPACT